MHRKLQRHTPIQFRKAMLMGCGIFIAAFFVLAFCATGYVLFMHNRIAYGISISGVAVGGMRIEEARALLSGRVQKFFSKIVLTGGGKDETVSLTTLGGSVLLDEALQRASTPGHRAQRRFTPPPAGQARTKETRIYPADGGASADGFLHDVLEMQRLQKHSLDIPLQLAFDETVLQQTLLEKFGSTIEHPATNAQATFDGTNIIITPAKDGVVIDRALLRQELARRIATFAAASVALAIIPEKPDISTVDAKAVAMRAEKILAAAPYFLFGNGERFTMSRTQVADWLSLEAQTDMDKPRLVIQFDTEKIDEYLMRIAPAMSRESRNAELGADAIGDEAYRARPSENALQLNVTSTQARIVAGLGRAERSITVSFDETLARINERLLLERGVTHLMGRGVSDFAGSPKNRRQNIRVAAEKYRGLFVEPGAVFSFDAHLGDIDAASGYVPELVIKEKKLIPEYGGGICQVSTTLFRAAIYAGLKILERTNHSIPVHYYGTPGFDATVYPPAPDMKFANTTSSTLYIQPRIEGTKLIFDLYGTYDGRKVTVEGPKIAEKKPDGSIKTVVVQKVYKNEELIQQKSFWSLYKNLELYKIERNPLE